MTNKIPTGWRQVKLGKITTSMRLGGNYENSEKITNLPLIKMGNLGRGFIKLNKIYFIKNSSEIDNKDQCRFEDLFFNTRNTMELVGKVSIWRSELPRAYYNSNLMRIEFDKTKVFSNFFMNYLFNSNKGLSSLKRYATGTTSVAAVYTRDLKKLPILLPPLSEQNRIVAILETWDKALEALTQKIELKKNIKKGLMQELLTGKRRLKEFRGEWKTTKLEDFINLEHGDGDWILSKNITQDGKYKIVQLGSIGLGRYINKKLKTVSDDSFLEINGTPILFGDLLINRMVDGNVNTCLFKKEGNYITSVDVCWIRENNCFSNYFLMNLILLEKNQQKLLVLSSGSGRVRISKKNLFSKFKFKLPSKEEQTEISSILETADEEITTLEKKKQILEDQKKFLLNNLITGQIRTPKNLTTSS